MVRKPKVRREAVRFYPGPDDDLLQWLATLDTLPFGGKSQAIKEMLRRGLGTGTPSATPAAPAAVDLSGWLPEIRRALAAELDQRQFTAAGTPPVAHPDEAAEAEALLEQLTANLILED